MTSKRTECRERLSGAGYKCQRLEYDKQKMMGAAALQRFLVQVLIPPQNSGQEHAIPDPPSDDNEIFEVEILEIQLDNTGCNIRAVYYSVTSGIGEPLISGHSKFAKIFSHTNEPLESGK